MIHVVGENIIDLVPDTAGGHEPLLGGGPANTAVALARLEVPTSFGARLGGDAHADRIAARLSAAGLPADAWIRTDAPSGLAEVRLDADGQAEYAFRLAGAADFGWRPGEPPVPSSGAVHFGSLAAYVEPGATVLADWAETLPRDTLVSFDPNIRLSVVGDAAAVRTRTERYAARADLVRVSGPDLAALYPGEPPAAVARRWITAGCGMVVHTAGADTGTVYTAEAEVSARPPEVTVADSIGAGDAFDAGLLAWLHENGALDRSAYPDVLGDAGVLADMLGFAYTVSALACTRAGAYAPTRAEVDDFAATGRTDAG